MRHVIVMTSTSSVGLMTLFLVDFADMYFLSLLGQRELAAAIGYAGSILFLTTSFSIGLSISVGALCARAIGAGHRRRARRYAMNTSIFSAVFTSVIALGVWWAIPQLLDLLGAKGETHKLAASYLEIIIPSMPIMAVAMSFSGILRAAGDAKRAMYVTLSGAAVNAVFDPIFIFTLGLGIEGAAWASVCARLTFFAVGFYGAVYVHGLVGRFRPSHFLNDIPAICAIALPAMATNIATPVGNAYVTAAMAQFGDAAVAGLAIISRVWPLAFGIIFSLSGAIGPIVGQNYGARQFPRVRQGIRDALVFAAWFVAGVTLFLYVTQSGIIAFFSADGEAAQLIGFFCTWVAVTYLFNAALFVSNAAFNNLDHPEYSTLFNWGKATLGTIPPAYFGGLWFGSFGVLAGQAVGSVIFGAAAVITLRILVRSLSTNPPAPKPSTGWFVKPRRGWWRSSINKGHDV